MKHRTQVVALALIIALLGLVSTLLIKLTLDGVTIHLKGQVDVAPATTGVVGEVTLVMPDPVSLIATGPEDEAIPAHLAVVLCPECGGTMP